MPTITSDTPQRRPRSSAACTIPTLPSTIAASAAARTGPSAGDAFFGCSPVLMSSTSSRTAATSTMRIAFDASRKKAEYEGDPLARKEIERLGGRIKDYYQDPVKIKERGIDHTEQVRIMLDIIVLAFWTDSTRVGTFMFGNEVSGRNFSFVPGVSGSHHETSHHENNPAKQKKIAAINTFHVTQLAYLLGKLKDIKEGAGTSSTTA